MATTFLEPGTDATQDFSFFASTGTLNGTITSDTSQSKVGPRSIKSDVTSSGGQATTDTATNVVADAGSLVSFWVRFSTTAPATDTKIFGISNSGGSGTVMGVGLSTTGTLRICGKGTTAQNGTSVLSANTWYRISIGYIITSTSNWSAQLYLNGVAEVSTSNADGTLTFASTGSISVGIVTSSVDSWATSAIMTAWYDSIYIDNRTDKTDSGNVHVTAKRPNANGTANNFNTQIGSGGSGYGTGHSPQVNEQPLSVTNGWSIVAVAATTEEYNIESSSTGDVNISTATLVDYMGWVYTKALIAETGQIVLNNVTSNISITTSNAMFTKAAGSTTYPAGTGTDIGEITSSTATTVSLYECGIVFAYIPASGTAIKGQTLGKWSWKI